MQPPIRRLIEGIGRFQGRIKGHGGLRAAVVCRLMISPILGSYHFESGINHQTSRLLGKLDLVDNLSILGIGLRDPQRSVVLLFAFNRTRKDD
jgi:hypothetical protein